MQRLVTNEKKMKKLAVFLQTAQNLIISRSWTAKKCTKIYNALAQFLAGGVRGLSRCRSNGALLT